MRNFRVRPLGVSLILIVNITISSFSIPYYCSVLPLCLVLTTACSCSHHCGFCSISISPPVVQTPLYFSDLYNLSLHNLTPPTSKPSYIIPRCAFFSPPPSLFWLVFFPQHCSPVSCDFCDTEKKQQAQSSKRKTDKTPLHCSLNFISETTTKRHIHNVLIPHSQLPLTEEHFRTPNIYCKVTTSACHFRMFYSVNPHLLVIHEQ